jgi:site-specific recombinase XerD
MSESDRQRLTQDGLFPGWAPLPQSEPVDSPLVELPPITEHTTISGLALSYRNYLRLQDHTDHTVDCFLSDLRLLTRFLGSDTPIGEVSREKLVDWLMHLRWGSNDRPAPKTMARRVTFIKNFFGWLASEGIVSDNIASSISFARPLPPLPEILTEEELARLILAAEADTRSHFLITLALDGGLKKEEILGLWPQHVDLSDPQHPTIMITSSKRTATRNANNVYKCLSSLYACIPTPRFAF